MAQDSTIYSPFPGFQERFVSSNVDFVIGGGAAGGGKTFAALLMAADQLDDPNFRMVFIRKNINDTKIGGGGADEAQRLYGHIGTMKISDSPRMTFPSGAFIDFTHMADQDPAVVEERVKGWQYSCIYVDEATAMEWSTIRILMSRNRSQARWSGKFRCTCNPKRNSWLRYWVDWYVDDDGDPIPERDGVVRYFFVTGDDITDVVLGSTPEEVYERCKNRINETLLKVNSHSDRIFTYKDLIKSYTFYGGNVAENKALMEKDPGYIGSLAAMGERKSRAYLLGNWNVDDDDSQTPIKRTCALEVGNITPQVNGDLWLTADLADTGSDNCVFLVWNGLHIIDQMLIAKSTPARNCSMIEHLAAKHNIGENHIIYDAQRAAYMLDHFPNARGFLSSKPATGKYHRVGERLKDICYLRIVELVNNGRLSMAPEVANAQYVHTRSKAFRTFLDEFVKECMVVQFDTTSAGKYKLPSKKAMNRQLGSNLSMDLLDAIAMRMWPLCSLEYGHELVTDEEIAHTAMRSIRGTIYDDSMWY